MTNIAQLIKDILEENGAPMHRKAIYAEIRKRGIVINGFTPMHNMSAHMSLHKDIFYPLGKGVWGLCAWPGLG